MKLTDRMQGVADLVTPGLVLADIGTDHSYLPIYLVKEQKIPKAIAMDVNRGPLKISQENIEKEGLSEQIATRLSDGLEQLEIGEAQSVIIAGMGGRLILTILFQGREHFLHVEEFILQPQSELELFRRQMKEWGFLCKEETMVCEDGKYYPMGRYVFTKESVEGLHFSPEELMAEEMTIEDLALARYGQGLLYGKHPVLKQYLLKEQAHLNHLKERLNGANQEKNAQRIAEIQSNQIINQYALEQF